MTTQMKTKVKCFVCGKKSEHFILTSTNSFGSKDLDLRPPQMMRGTMAWWIQKCPNCGYVNDSLQTESAVNKEWLASEEYCSCDNINFKSSLAKKFYQQYLITNYENKTNDSFYALLHCAWACDDSNDNVNAKHCRKMAINLLEKLIDKSDNRETMLLLKADLLRRSDQFDRLIEEYKEITFSEEFLNNILAFQIKLAKNGDNNCYLISDVG